MGSSSDMRRLINLFESGAKVTKASIVKLAREYFTLGGKIRVNADGTIDVEGLVQNHNGKNISELPVQFGKVGGDFWCTGMGLNSLVGTPREVGRHFYCGNNPLATLEHGPLKVNGTYDCRNCGLKSLLGVPADVESLWCLQNQLTSLDGGPIRIADTIQATDNPIVSLSGWPESVRQLYITWCESLPLLRAVGLEYVSVQGNTLVGKILYKYMKQEGNLRQRVVQCQKELIDAGFEGNAKW
jgi:hypothetical protein